jgi:hypothetical protein
MTAVLVDKVVMVAQASWAAQQLSKGSDMRILAYGLSLVIAIVSTPTLASQAGGIRGTYWVEASNHCSTLLDPSATESSMKVEIGPNGLPQVRVSSLTAPVLNTSTYQMKVNPITRTMTASIPTVRVVESSSLPWQRSDRRTEIIFNYDRADDTIVVASKRTTWIQPFAGEFAELVSSGDKFRTIDGGQTFFQEVNTFPVIGKLTETLGSVVRYYSVICTSQLNARRISTQF